MGATIHLLSFHMFEVWLAWDAEQGVYITDMKTQDLSESREKLIRVQADRRGVPVELCVQYEVSNSGGCLSYRILAIEERN